MGDHYVPHERIVNAHDDGRTLRTAPGAEGVAGQVWMSIHLAGSAHPLRTAIVSPENLVAALDGLIPGLSVSYEKPIAVPTGLGAVVEDGSFGARFVRTESDPEYPWGSPGEDNQWPDAHIRAVLRSGGKVLSEGVQP